VCARLIIRFAVSRIPAIIHVMNAEALRQLFSVRPFEPIDVELSSGQSLTIKHPENVMVLKNTLVIADPETDTVRWTSLIHIVSVRWKQTALPA